MTLLRTTIMTAGVLAAGSLPAASQALPESAVLPAIDLRLGPARARTENAALEVTTGRIARRWKWTGAGLVTISLRDEQTGREWTTPQTAQAADWNLPGAIGEESRASLLALTVKEDDDEGFTGKHLEVVTRVRYEKARLELEHVIWVYPNAPGLRTQLRVKALDGFSPKGLPSQEGVREDCGHKIAVPSARAEYLPLDFSVSNARRYWGYYNNPGGRHDQSRDMLREEVVTGFPIFLDEDNDWASGLSVEYGQGEAGVCVVKESPKCVNQQSHYTGSFYAGPSGLAVTGWGLTPAEILPERFRECWAAWTLVFNGGNDGLQLALKQFDRARYPVFPERDLMLINDTWGPANPGGAQFTKQDYLLKEIPLLAQLGVEVLRIDDGWQTYPWGGDKEVFRPNYPDGWKALKSACDQNGLKLGLWVAIRRAKTQDLLQDLDEAGVVTWKIDFDHLASRGDYEQRLAQVREIMKHAWMRTQFSFCPEYDDPRYGWYFAKEYGSIYFQNIQESLPAHLTMVPYQVLRQHWLMARYYNADKLQVLLQNPKRVNPARSDAPRHSHAYCFAMGVPFVPVFFQSAQYLDAPGRDELRKFIQLYKEHRQAIFTSYTFPIGDKPDNASWSGFQTYSPERGQDYLLLFRELHNGQTRRSLRLKFLAHQDIVLTDLEKGGQRTLHVTPDGMAEFEMPEPAGYRFFAYTHPAQEPPSAASRQ